MKRGLRSGDLESAFGVPGDSGDALKFERRGVWEGWLGRGVNVRPSVSGVNVNRGGMRPHRPTSSLGQWFTLWPPPDPSTQRVGRNPSKGTQPLEVVGHLLRPGRGEHRAGRALGHVGHPGHRPSSERQPDFLPGVHKLLAPLPTTH